MTKEEMLEKFQAGESLTQAGKAPTGEIKAVDELVKEGLVKCTKWFEYDNGVKVREVRIA